MVKMSLTSGKNLCLTEYALDNSTGVSVGVCRLLWSECHDFVFMASLGFKGKKFIRQLGSLLAPDFGYFGRKLACAANVLAVLCSFGRTPCLCRNNKNQIQHGARRSVCPEPLHHVHVPVFCVMPMSHWGQAPLLITRTALSLWAT